MRMVQVRYVQFSLSGQSCDWLACLCPVVVWGSLNVDIIATLEGQLPKVESLHTMHCVTLVQPLWLRSTRIDLPKRRFMHLVAKEPTRV
jgi:hypothetical protein